MSGARPPARDLETFALKKKVLRLETLYDLSRSLAAARDEKALLEEILARAVPVLDAARGFASVVRGRFGSEPPAHRKAQPLLFRTKPCSLAAITGFSRLIASAIVSPNPSERCKET